MALSENTLTRRQLITMGGVALATAATTSSAAMLSNSLEITRHDVFLPNLDPIFDGTTITLASDIHSSQYMSLADMKEIVLAINDLKSDYILLPGDFVTDTLHELPPFLEAFSELKANTGIFASLGNHDFDADADAVTKGLEEIGIRTLRNENCKLTKNNKDLYLIGIDEVDDETVIEFIDGKPAEHIEAAYKHIPNNAASILLCHKPYRFEEYAQTGIGLMVSGHTHGGQIVLGRLGRTPISLCSLGTKYVDGWFSYEGKSKMYVSRGLGVVDIPIRVNCPPELSQFTLRSQSFAHQSKVEQ